ncbi:MAG TPA: HEAT repeat domain-containing protein [Pirellulaceae bacterium]|nr:HEAT repeat domain-containing protein [Pirellulaceae bacterium]
MPRILSLACLLTLWLSSAALAQLVAPTGPLTPAEQQKKFKLPPGFAIQLVASEPHVNKPMNLKFDARGRLWVTHSLEYPFAAKDGAKARDAITIFSNLQAPLADRKVQRFAEHLNIPIGVLPWKDNEAIAWSIPNLYRLTDTDGDQVADQRQVAFGPFGVIDTHGNQNSLTRWLDGWVYACHGFNNHSQVKLGGEGDVVLEMQSGNTYRFRPDGSAIEQQTWGQVNPFGLCFDPLGNIFTADCHSRPVTMLLRGGYYQSFGKPHDGLGYAPEATDKDHGGTGIAGMLYYDAQQFPAEYRDVLFVGNVITNRIHCDRLKWSGSSPQVTKIEDFLTCDDPWFRPVDIQLGPDGALYVADFYNKIIGHYEVPLTHPERDRERGRIWRIAYHGDKKEAIANTPNFQTATLPELVALLGDANISVRTFATHAIVDRFAAQATDAVMPVFKGDSAPQRAHALWVVSRINGINEALAKTLSQDPDRLVRTHLAHALGETKSWEAWQGNVTRGLLADADAFVTRAAVTALAKHPAADNIAPLLKLLQATPVEDPQLLQATRIALRDQLRSAVVAEQLAKLELTPEARKQLLPIAAVVPNGPAALLIYDAALQGQVDDNVLAKALPAAVRYIDTARIDTLCDLLAKRYANDANFQLTLLRDMADGLAQRGLQPTDKLRVRITDLLRPALAGETTSGWSNHPVPGAAPSPSPWMPEKRPYRGQDNDTPVISSILDRGTAGERMTGVLRSPTFVLPAKLSFWMCGHDGPPGANTLKKNYARLVLADGTEVARSYPPSDDTAQPFHWDLAKFAGQQGYLEVVDGVVADGYAWLAIGRIEPAVIRVPTKVVNDSATAKAEAFRLAGQLRLEALTPAAVTASGDYELAPTVRLAACNALTSLKPVAAIEPLTKLVADSQLPTLVRQQAAEALGRIDQPQARAALVEQLRIAPQAVSIALATALANQQSSGELLLAEIRAGKASAALLREPQVVARLKTAKIKDLDQQITELTAKLVPSDDRIAQLIAARRAGYHAGKFDSAQGRAVFARSACAQCHKIGVTGATLAPALDGIGTRGLDRLLEDILDPSRNVDQAFRMQIVATTGGQTHSGFGVREEGQTLVMHDSQGKPVRIPLAEVDERSTSTLSPMPGNITDQINETDLYHLLAFLLSERMKPTEP